MYILGIDIGTTKIAGVLLEVPGKRMVEAVSVNSEADIPSPHEWERTQNPDVILQKAESIIADLKGKAKGKIACIGISSQMHGFLYVDGDGRSSGPLYTWQDNRAAVPVEPAGKSARELIQDRTGKSVYSGYALATHYYNFLKGLAPDSPYRIVSIGGYLGMRLCGLTEATIDPSEGAGFGLYDPDAGDFCLDEIRSLWGHTDFLPACVSFHYQMGWDGEGVPVFQSMGDNQASFYGAMEGREESLLLNLGTGGQVSLLMDKPPSCLKGLEVRPYPGKCLVVGATLAGGKSFDMLMDFLGDVLSFFGKPLSKREILEIIDKADFHSPPVPLRVEPFFNGTRENPDVRGSIGNIELDNLTTSHLVYAFAEAMVGELKDLLEENSLDRPEILRHIVGSGNGIRRNPLVRRLIEELFHCRLFLSDLKEEAACGAALYAYEGLIKSSVK